jgi:hypothetical protein
VDEGYKLLRAEFDAGDEEEERDGELTALGKQINLS